MCLFMTLVGRKYLDIIENVPGRFTTLAVSQPWPFQNGQIIYMAISYLTWFQNSLTYFVVISIHLL